MNFWIPTGTSVESSVNMSNPTLYELFMENRRLKRYPKSLQKNLAKAFPCQISSLCVDFIRHIKFNRRRLLNWVGRIIVSYYQSLIRTSATFMKKKPSIPIGQQERQIESSLFERLLLSHGDINKKQMLALALQGNEISTPSDIIRDWKVRRIHTLLQQRENLSQIKRNEPSSIPSSFTSNLIFNFCLNFGVHFR